MSADFMGKARKKSWLDSFGLRERTFSAHQVARTWLPARAFVTDAIKAMST